MKFADLEIHPALASALAASGYDTPTSVQAAVLDAGCAGRDLLVSSQTGSGKTIAFGAALAGTLLGPTDVKIPHGPKPVALVIVPTRELATQVREELRWLLHATNVRLASFTGGTPVGGDLKVLQRGVELVIGTPGRLVDLIRRERLSLANLKVVVLDEADEMLDLGFREDLETLLKTAPATRRTLLLSATLPGEIRTLARKYQRDALAIDPRKDAGGAHDPGKAAHDDITHHAHLIANSDRLAAVVNVLRASGDGRAIVFCTTREGVAGLHAALTARGFAATAISGDRAQAERDRALDQLRRGDARVLVATNVAARGLHLPDVDLIIHADLPLNADSLVHRSGRTGRAGRKGTAVVIATVAERRKAERLLAEAHVKAAWTPAPSADAIVAAARSRLADELLAEAPAEDGDGDAGAVDHAGAMLAQLEGKLPVQALLRRLLSRELARMPVGEPIRAIPVPSGRAEGYDSGRESAPRRSRSEFTRDGVLFRVNLGGKDKADPGWLLPLICRRGNVTRREVGAIRIGPRDSQFEIAGDAAQAFEVAAAERDPRAPHVTFERASPNAGRQASRPAHAARPPQPHAPRDAARPPQPHAPRDAARPPQPHAPRDAARPPQPHAPRDAARPPEPHAPRDAARPPQPHAPRDAARPPQLHAPRDGSRPAYSYGARPPHPNAPRAAIRTTHPSSLRAVNRPAHAAPRDMARPAHSQSPRPAHSQGAHKGKPHKHRPDR